MFPFFKKPSSSTQPGEHAHRGGCCGGAGSHAHGGMGDHRDREVEPAERSGADPDPTAAPVADHAEHGRHAHG